MFIQTQTYIRKSTKDNSKWWSYQSRIEASSQSKAALLRAAATDSYYERIARLQA